MPFNTRDFKGFHCEQLKVFCQQVTLTKQTPELISMVAGDSDYIDYCRKITDPDEEKRKMFASFCRESGFNPDEILIRVCLVATALGVYKQADYYGIMGVRPDADEADIKKAYRKKAKILHPDKQNGDEESSDAFIELHAAYTHLSDPEFRRAYDVTAQGAGPWVEGDSVPVSPKRRSAVGRFVSWVCVLAGGVVIAAYAFDLYQIQRPHVASRQPAEAPVKESETTKSAGLKKSAVSDVTAKPMADDTAETADMNFPPKAKTASFATKAPKEVVEKTGEVDSAGPVKKAAVAKPSSRTVKKKKPTVRKTPVVRKIAKANAPKKATPPAIKTAASGKPSKRASEKKKPSAGKIPAVPEIAKAAVSRKPLSTAVQAIAVAVDKKKAGGVQSGSKDKKVGANDVYILKKQRVLAFLHNYTKTYEEKNLDQFKTFFAKNALEQGQSFETLLPKYQQTFDSVDGLKYQIELTSVSLEKGVDKIFIEGYFTALYQLPDDDENDASNWGRSTGSIRMELLDETEGLLVSRMDYEFEH